MRKSMARKTTRYGSKRWAAEIRDFFILFRWLTKLFLQLPGAEPGCASFEILDEDHTLGNSLRYMIMKKYAVTTLRMHRLTGSHAAPKWNCADTLFPIPPRTT